MTEEQVSLIRKLIQLEIELNIGPPFWDDKIKHEIKEVTKKLTNKSLAEDLKKAAAYIEQTVEEIKRETE